MSFYGDTHVAYEGEFDLSESPSIQKWIARIQANSKYIGIE
jgi:glutathione S-transferase